MTSSINGSYASVPQPMGPVSMQEAIGGGANVGGAPWTIEGSYVEIPSINKPFNGPNATDVSMPNGANANGASGAPNVTGGGGQQAVAGAAAVSPQQVEAALQRVVDGLTALIAAIKQMRGSSSTGGGGGAAAAPAAVQSTGGAAAAPETTPAAAAPAPAADPAPAAPAVTGGGDSPPRVASSASEEGLSDNARSVLDMAREMTKGTEVPLGLADGKSARESSTSDHPHGNAVDISNIGIGEATSDRHSPEMVAFRDHLLAEAKAGKAPEVKYVISEGKIYDSGNNWEGEDYFYGGRSAEDLAQLKVDDPGEYNRIQHFDHVHVSVN